MKPMVVFFTLLVVLAAAVHASTVTRSFSSPVAPNSQVQVSLTLSLTGTEGFYVIDEIIPAGFIIQNPSSASTQTPGHLKWFVTSGVQNIVYTYTLTTPASPTVAQFAGTYIFQSASTAEIPIAGPTNIQVASSCTENWQCTSYTPAVCPQSGTQTRTCTDTNTCGTTLNKPATQQSCTPSCTPNWQCTSFSPAVCPQSGTQTRTCTDTNTCGNNSGKPSESQSCTPSAIPPSYATFDGATTNFASIANLSTVQNVVLERLTKGRIAFGSQSLNMIGLNLDTYVTISNNLIAIDGSALPELNKPATLTLYNINLVQPRLMVDGVSCPANNCNIVSFQNKTLVFTVQHFSSYSATEGSTPPVTDDLQVNYIRGKIRINSAPAPAGFEYTLTVTSGSNAGSVYIGHVDANIPASLQGNGYFDTRDNPLFNTGDTFSISVPIASATAVGTFISGGQGTFSPETGLIFLDLALTPPVVSPLPAITINEDSAFANPIIDLYAYTSDDLPLNRSVFIIAAETNPALTSCSVVSNRYIHCSAPPADQHGTSTVTVKVTDPSLLFDSENFLITVQNVNDAPTLNTIGTQTLIEDVPYTLQLSAQDKDGDVLTFTTNSSLFQVNPNGSISLTPTNEDVGRYKVNVTVTDPSGAQDSEIVTFIIDNVNDAPVLNPLPTIIMNEDSTVSLDFTALIADPDNQYDQFTLSFANAQHYVFTIAKQTSTQLIYNITTIQNYFGSDSVEVTVKDPLNAASTQNLSLTVLPVNDAPVLSEIPGQTGIEGVLFTYQTHATDIEDVNLTYALSQFPVGATINPQTGKITWLPTSLQVGKNQFKVIVEDSEHATNEKAFNVTVQSTLDLSAAATVKVENAVYADTYTIENSSVFIAKPGDMLTFNFGVLNRGDDDIDDVVVSVSAINLKNQTTRFNIFSGITKNSQLTLAIPAVSDIGVYQVLLNGSGVDHFGIPRKFERTYTLNLTKEFHRVIIASASLEKNVVKCFPYVTMNVSLINQGSLLEDDVNLTVKSNNLHMEKSSYIGVMNPNDHILRSFDFDLRGVSPGQYSFVADIEYNNFDNISSVIVPLTVEECTLPEKTVLEDTTPPQNWIDLWESTSNGVNGSEFAYSILSQNSSLLSCSLTKDASSSKLRYINCSQPSADKTGFSLLNISMSRSGKSITRLARIDVLPVNDAPVQSAPLPYTAGNEDTIFTTPWLLKNFFTDIDSSVLTFSATGSAHIGVTVNPNGSLTFAPSKDFAGAEQITVKASDGEFEIISSLTVNVIEMNDDAPVIHNIIPMIIPVLPEDAIFTLRVNATDPDSPVLNIRWYVNGVLKGVGDNFNFIGNNSIGIEDFLVSVNVSDGTHSDTKEVTLTTSDAPVSDLYQISWNGTLNSAYLIIEKPNVGKIEFIDAVNLENIASIDQFVVINQGIAGINTSNQGSYNLHALSGKKARITLYNVKSNDIHYSTAFTVLTSDPICATSVCKNINLTGTRLTFEVNSFSTYGVFGMATPGNTGETGTGGTNSTSTGTSSSSPVTTFKFGDANQDASNPDVGGEVIVQKNFIIKNDQSCSVVIEGLHVLPSDGFSGNDLKITLLSAQDNILLPGEETSITLSGRIPESLSAVDEKHKVSAFETAHVQFTGMKCDLPSNDILGDFSVQMQRKNHLELDKAEFSLGTSTQKVNNDGDSVDHLKPGDQGDVDITVQNTFRDSTKLSIEEIEVGIQSDDSDIDADDSEDLGRIGTNDDDSETFDIEIDEDADDGNVNLIVYTFGVDKYGARHGESWDIDLEIDRERDEILIDRLEISPDKILCGQRKTSFIAVSLRNSGKHDNDEVVVEVDAPELEWFDKISDIKLDQDDTTARTFGIVVPDTTPGGIYSINVKSYYDTTSLSDQRSAQLEVKDCEVREISQSTKETEEVKIVKDNVQLLGTLPIKTGAVQAQAVATNQPVAKTKINTFGLDSFDLAVLVSLAIILLAGVILFSALAIAKVKRRQRRRRHR